MMTTTKSGRWEEAEVRLKILRARLTPVNCGLQEGPKCSFSLSLHASKVSGTQQVLSQYLLED